jgi:hypothetical protein
MVHRAEPHAPDPVLRADPGLARDCEECRGWGTVVTEQGHHELCPVCQPAASWPAEVSGRVSGDGEDPAPAAAAHAPAHAREESPTGGQ